MVSPHATPEAVIDGYRQLIELTHARGLRVLLATLTPVGGVNGVGPEVDGKRQAVNTWIREQLADGVVDFGAAVRDPADPSRIAPAYDGSDHLHFDLAGYRAMGDAVPLGRLTDPMHVNRTSKFR